MRRNRRQRKNKPEPHLRLLEQLAHDVDDSMLNEIAEADYADSVDSHWQALTKIRDSLSIPNPLQWYPGEVLQLIRWSEPRDPEWSPGSTGIRGHTMRAFCCAVLLLSADQEGGNMEGSEVDSLARLIDSSIELGPQYERLTAEFLQWRIARLTQNTEERPFFLFAQLFLHIRVGTSLNPLVVVRRVRDLEAEEHRIRTSSWAVLPIHNGSWLLGLTFYDQSHHYWRNFARELFFLSETKLKGQAKVEVQRLAQRIDA